MGIHGRDWSFCEKDDALSIAKDNGKVYRNFGGETPGYTQDMISQDLLLQAVLEITIINAYDLIEYTNFVNTGKFPINKNIFYKRWCCEEGL